MTLRVLGVLTISTALLAACGDDETAGGTGNQGAGAQGGNGQGGDGLQGATGGLGASGGTGGVGIGGAGEGGSAPVCMANDPCGECVADFCCVEGTACGDDADCLAASICLAMCDDTFDACVASCNAGGNATFTTYATCMGDNGCGPMCVNTL